jgi:site-specific recombinase XerD
MPSVKSRHRVTERHTHPVHDRLKIELRNKSRFYQACTYFDGRIRQHSTRTSSLTTALKLGDEWYRKLIGNKRPPHPRVAADASCAEIYGAYKLTLDPKPRSYAEMKWRPIQEFWATKDISEISGGTFHEFYAWRKRRKIKNHTVYKDVVLIRQILRYAAERSVITSLPVVPRVGKIETNPRPWLTVDEFDRLRAVSHERIEDAKNNPRLHRQRSDCHEFMMMMYHSNFRVNELRSLKFGECRFGENERKEVILISEIEGKTGYREVVTRENGANIFSARQDERLDQLQHDETKVAGELVFPHKTRDAFRELLKEAKLYKGVHEQTRNLKSMRCTAIAVQVLAGVSPLWIAKNAGTSITMIDTYYVKRLTPLMAKNELTSFDRVKNPEMFAKLALESVPIPITKARPKNKASLDGTTVPPSSHETPGKRLPKLSPEMMREFSKARQSTSSPTSKEISEFLAQRQNKNKKTSR